MKAETLTQLVQLTEQDGLSISTAAYTLGIPRSTASDALRARRKRLEEGAGRVVQGGDRSLQEGPLESPKGPLAQGIKAPILSEQFVQTTKNLPDGPHKHLVIPDTQMKPGISTEYLRRIGEYIVDKRPDVIIHIGDHADMPSLSSYDKGKASAEGRRVQDDLDAAKAGMVALLSPLKKLQEAQKKARAPIYAPKMVLTLGNHEFRIMRHVEANPELFGFLSYDNLEYEKFGWEVFDFLEPAVVDGVTYIHFMPNPMTGKPYPGLVGNTLKTVGESFTQGHKQTLEVSTRFLPSGRQQWAIIAGACYSHEESYKGHVGNLHWRGVILKHGVQNGSYDPCFVSLSYLKERYGNETS